MNINSKYKLKFNFLKYLFKNNDKKGVHNFEKSSLIKQLESLDITQRVAKDLVEHSHPKAIQGWIKAMQKTKRQKTKLFLKYLLQKKIFFIIY